MSEDRVEDKRSFSHRFYNTTITAASKLLPSLCPKHDSTTSRSGLPLPSPLIYPPPPIPPSPFSLCCHFLTHLHFSAGMKNSVPWPADQQNVLTPPLGLTIDLLTTASTCLGSVLSGCFQNLTNSKKTVDTCLGLVQSSWLQNSMRSMTKGHVQLCSVDQRQSLMRSHARSWAHPTKVAPCLSQEGGKSKRNRRRVN